MNKIFVCIALAITLLAGCGESQQYEKVAGEVISKHITGGRYSDIYYIVVSYPSGGGKFTIDDIDVGDKTNYDNYNVKDKVTVYVNENGIGEITK
jgi:hypothetical protein